MKQHIHLLLALCSLLSACNAQGPDLSRLSAEQWRDDIRFFMEQAPRTHVNLYHTLPKSRFDSIGHDLMSRVPQLSPQQITAELARWTAALGDGHTQLRPSDGHTYPMLPFWFKEGFYITDAQPEGKVWIGWKLLKINSVEVETVAERVRPYQQRDGEQQIRAQAPGFMMSAEALQAIGLVKGREKAIFTLKNTQTGEVKTAELQPMPMADVLRNRHGGDARDTDTDAPLYRRHRDKFYWFEWLPDSKTLYFQYNVTQEQPHQSVANFVKKLAKAADEHPLERFVVDLRWNGGGNLFTSKPFTEFIVRHPKINQRGKLYVIIGRHTFSAASYFASTMEFRSSAIFVGEPTGASPNHYGDTRPVRLPNSGLEPRLSTIFWQNSFPWDKRPATQPDLLVEPTAADWLANRDAALDAIFQHKILPVNTLSVPESMKKAVMGRYLFGGDKLVDIREQDGRLHLSIEGFIETPLYLTRAEGPLSAEVRSLRVSPAEGGRLHLEAMGGSAVLEKLPEGHLLPKEMLLAGKTAEAQAAYRALKRERPAAFSISENELNRLGYEMMNARQMDAARTLFELNTEFYPEGFNTWDSLAEWHMNMSNKPQAIEYYKKSLALNPNNDNAKQMLRKLE